MAEINWNTGRLITLKEGDTARCEGLNRSQLYGLFFYNAAPGDASVDLRVTWSSLKPPTQFSVPGTTANQGYASVLFVYGGDTDNVSVALTQGQKDAKVESFIGSVKMPTDTTGMNNWPLPADGQPKPFKKFTRYFAVPPSHWHNFQIGSGKSQFIVVMFSEQHARVMVTSKTTNPDLPVGGVGTVEEKRMYSTTSTSLSRITEDFQGDGRQRVWINASSVQDSERASITLQSLQALGLSHEPQDAVATG